jgi:hypothetical protein
MCRQQNVMEHWSQFCEQTVIIYSWKVEQVHVWSFVLPRNSAPSVYLSKTLSLKFVFDACAGRFGIIFPCSKLDGSNLAAKRRHIYLRHGGQQQFPVFWSIIPYANLYGVTRRRLSILVNCLPTTSALVHFICRFVTQTYRLVEWLNAKISHFMWHW